MLRGFKSVGQPILGLLTGRIPPGVVKTVVIVDFQRKSWMALEDTQRGR